MSSEILWDWHVFLLFCFSSHITLELKDQVHRVSTVKNNFKPCLLTYLWSKCRCDSSCCVEKRSDVWRQLNPPAIHAPTVSLFWKSCLQWSQIRWSCYKVWLGFTSLTLACNKRASQHLHFLFLYLFTWDFPLLFHPHIYTFKFCPTATTQMLTVHFWYRSPIEMSNVFFCFYRFIFEFFCSSLVSIVKWKKMNIHVSIYCANIWYSVFPSIIFILSNWGLLGGCYRAKGRKHPRQDC